MSEEHEAAIVALKELKASEGWATIAQTLQHVLVAEVAREHDLALKGSDALAIRAQAQRVEDIRRFLRMPDEAMNDFRKLMQEEETESERRSRAEDRAAASTAPVY